MFVLFSTYIKDLRCFDQTLSILEERYDFLTQLCKYILRKGVQMLYCTGKSYSEIYTQKNRAGFNQACTHKNLLSTEKG